MNQMLLTFYCFIPKSKAPEFLFLVPQADAPDFLFLLFPELNIPQELFCCCAESNAPEISIIFLNKIPKGDFIASP